MGLIYPKLIGCKPNSDKREWQLEAAESIEQIDDTHIRFQLKPGLRWSGDFGEITAENVQYPFERVLAPRIARALAGDWGPLRPDHHQDTHPGVVVRTEHKQENDV